MTTLKEIAKAAGVSTTTVSNVINGNHRRVSEETIALIQDIVRRSGYTPNQAARSLAQRESRLIAVIQQAHGEENTLLNPYNAVFIGALTAKLYGYGYYPLLRFTDDYRSANADIQSWNVAGTVINGSFRRNLEQFDSLGSVPTVLTDCYFDVPGVNHVGLDDRAGGRMAAEYLRRMGHSRVGYVANALADSDVEQQRLVGFTQVTPIPEGWIIPADALMEEGGSLDRVLDAEDRPTAFFCAADMIALVLIQQLNRRGLNVPRDVSVMGFDDLPISILCTPRLTTVAQDVDRKAQQVVDMLMRHIRDKALSPERAVLGVSIAERDSVARVE